MHSATIPLAALATFAAVYTLTPAPAPVAVELPAPAVETVEIADAPAPRAGLVEEPRRARRPKVSRARARPAVRASLRSRPATVYFSGCNEVRAAGLAPLFRGQPGYRAGMDGDDDGIACEGRRR